MIVDTYDESDPGHHNEEVQPADNEYDDETGGSFTEQGPSPVEPHLLNRVHLLMLISLALENSVMIALL